VYGPVRTVVWQGSAGDRRPYADQVDLTPDLEAKTLTVRLHHLTPAAHDSAVRYLCDELTATETIFPGTDLRLVYKLGSG